MGRLSKAKWCLLGCLIVVVVLAAMSVFLPGRLAGLVGFIAGAEPAGQLRALVEPEEIQEGSLIEMVVEEVGVSAVDYQPVVVLKQKDGGFYLPILIGLGEANAISVVVDGAEVPRPLTHDLLCTVIERMEAAVDYVVINDLRDQTFYASLILHSHWTKMEIDARPSDAIAIALRAGVPIYLDNLVLEKVGALAEQEAELFLFHNPGVEEQA